jgi:hypothetical protein
LLGKTLYLLAGEDAHVEDIPISSAVVAAKSHVIRRMLSSGMRESNKENLVVLRLKSDGERQNLPSF